jgi:hypothetical protein
MLEYYVTFLHQVKPPTSFYTAAFIDRRNGCAASDGNHPFSV